MAEELTVSAAVAELRQVDLFFRGFNVEQLRRRLARLGQALDVVERLGRLEAEANEKARQAAGHLAQLETVVAKARVEAEDKLAAIRASYEAQASGIREHLAKVQAEADQVTRGAAEAVKSAQDAAVKAQERVTATQRDLEQVSASRDLVIADLSDLELRRNDARAALKATQVEVDALGQRLRERMERMEAAMKG